MKVVEKLKQALIFPEFEALETLIRELNGVVNHPLAQDLANHIATLDYDLADQAADQLLTLLADGHYHE